MIDKQRLDEIKQRESKATKGPWVNMGEVDSDNPFFGRIWTANEVSLETIALMPESDDRTDDFNFIAYAREDVPDLLAEVERLQAENDSLRQQINNLVVPVAVSQ